MAVIGGGTGGISFAEQARELGLSVALFDYVNPSRRGSSWGLGGTCLNVGCIPKKLFHIGAQLQESAHLKQFYGWIDESEGTKHDWESLRENVQNSIKGANFKYRILLEDIDVDYVNAFAAMEDPNHVKFMYED